MQPLILIIDDEAPIREVAGDILEQAGYRVALAANVAEGLKQIRQCQPDLVLCDIFMPDGNGYEVLDSLQKSHQPMPPFIFMSGQAILPEDIRKGMRSGADDYLLKPFRVQDLVDSVQARLERQRKFSENMQRLSGPELPAFFSGGVSELLAQVAEEPPAFLLALRLDHHERFRHIFGKAGARWLCYSVFQQLKQLPICEQIKFYASEHEHQLYLLPMGPEAGLEGALEEALREAFSHSFAFDRYQLHLQASLGWVYTEAERFLIPQQWLERCNLALYQSQLQGGGLSIVYQPQMEQKLHERLHWEEELQLALDEGRFELFYQPQFALGSRQIIGLEALLRLRHPKFGLIPPGDFIPVAEASGLIVPMGTWVLRQACQTLCELKTLGYGHLRMAVNVSLLQFQAPDFGTLVAQILSETGVSAQQLELELTESLLIDNFQQVKQLLTQLKETGLTLAVDDFGTGYSSLFYINQLPFDTLKIDQSFVRSLSASNPFTQVIPRAIVEMGHGMGMQVLAEGIETAEQLQVLAGLGCDFGQGFYISRPLPMTALLALLQASAG